MSDSDDTRKQVTEDQQEDLELLADDAEGVVGGNTAQRADGSLDAGIHFKYDIKAQKEG